MIDSAVWWLAIEAIGLVAFPQTFVVFRFLPDRGYNFAKIFGLVLTSYLLWLGATLHAIPNRRWSILLILALLALASAALLYRHRLEIARFIRRRWRQLLFAEIFFTAVFALALFLRSLTPDSLTSTNDNRFGFAFLNATIRADYFPPEDPWLSGHPISYYYFGFVMLGVLSKLTGVASQMAFHLSIVAVAALTANGAFGIVFNLLIDRGKVALVLACGALAGILFIFLGSLTGVFELLAAHGFGSEGFYRTIDIYGLDGPRQSSEWYPTEYLWPDRAAIFADGRYDGVFPFYDLLLPVGYLSGHSIGFPVMLLVLAAITNLWRSDHSFWRAIRLEHVATVGGTALALGALIATHSWDFPTACLLLLATVALRNYRLEGQLNLAVFGRTVLLVAFTAATACIIYAPYFAHASGQFGGIVTMPGTLTTKPHHLLYMWLPMLWLSLGLAVSALPRPSLKDAAIWAGLALPLAVIIGWAAYIALDGTTSQLWDEVEARDYRWLTVAIIAPLLGLTTVALLNQTRPAGGPEHRDDTVTFALTFSATVLLLLLGLEFFQVDDVTRSFFGDFSTTLRVNFQAWLLFSLAGSYGIYRIATARTTTAVFLRLAKAVWVAGTVLVIAGGMVYPVATGFYFEALSGGERHLDALFPLKRNQPDEYEAIKYLNENVEGSPVILEAVTNSYSFGGRISAYTGLPTVLGWPMHVSWFHGSGDSQVGRKEDVETAYMTTDPALASRILAAYDVEYVYVGPLERGQYGGAGLAKFHRFMDIAFERGQVTIYKTR